MPRNEANEQWCIWARSDDGEQAEFMPSDLWRFAENAKDDQPDTITLVAVAAEGWTHYESSDEDSVGPPMDDSNDTPISDEDGDDDDDDDVRCDVRGDASDGGVCARGFSKKMRVA